MIPRQPTSSTSTPWNSVTPTRRIAAIRDPMNKRFAHCTPRG